MSSALRTFGRWLLEAIALSILTPALQWVWRKIIVKLGEDAVFGWANTEIAKALGLKPLDVADVVSFIVDWVIPFAVAVGILVAYHFVHRRLARQSVVVADGAALRKKAMWPYWTLLFLCMAGAVFALSRIAAGPVRSAQAVAWRFDEPNGSFLGISLQDRREPLITIFGAHGKNVSGRMLHPTTSFIRSEVANASIPVLLSVDGVRMAVSDTTGIPAESEFDLLCEFPNVPADLGVEVQKFLAEFGAFTFVFEYVGGRYERRFSAEEIDRLVRDQERRARGGKPPPIVPKAPVAQPSPSPPPRAEPAPKPPPTPPSPAVQKSGLEPVLRELSGMINSDGLSASRAAKNFIGGEIDSVGLNPNVREKSAKEIRDKIQEIANLAESFTTKLYREFLPRNKYYEEEILSALDAKTSSISESPVYAFQQSALSYVGALHSAMLIAETSADSSKRDYIAREALMQTQPQYVAFAKETERFRMWIDACNDRIAAKVRN